MWISGPSAQASTIALIGLLVPLCPWSRCNCVCVDTVVLVVQDIIQLIETIDSVDSEADLVDTTVFVLLYRDPRLVPMTYGPQALYRPADNSLGRLRVTISQVLCGVETGVPYTLYHHDHPQYIQLLWWLKCCALLGYIDESLFTSQPRAKHVAGWS